MLVEILKNPVIFGLLAGAIIYNYMAWNRKKEVEKRLKKGKKIKEEMKYNDIIIPSIVAIIVWFIAFAYFNHIEDKSIQVKQNPQAINPSIPPIPSNIQQLGGSPSDINHSFTLVNKTGMTLPNVFV